jgi:hypothetical protein
MCIPCFGRLCCTTQHTKIPSSGNLAPTFAAGSDKPGVKEQAPANAKLPTAVRSMRALIANLVDDLLLHLDAITTRVGVFLHLEVV